MSLYLIDGNIHRPPIKVQESRFFTHPVYCPIIELYFCQVAQEPKLVVLQQQKTRLLYSVSNCVTNSKKFNFCSFNVRIYKFCSKKIEI